MRRQWALWICGLLLISCSRPEPAKEPAAKEDAKTATPFISFSGKTPEELKKYHLILETSLGKIELGFFPEVAPEHVRNFLRLSQAGFYDHTAWHRVVRGFVIQGGDLGTRNPPLQAADMMAVRKLQPEFSRLKHKEGILSMARGDTPNSAETSFFICLAPQPKLDNKYTIFGEVVSGLDTVKKIAEVPVRENGRPWERIEIVRAEVVEAQR
jgi:peptidyl-prolyl cis-trans isomerase B (cyclophilin B)